MTSRIDPTLPIAGSLPDSAVMRSQFQAAIDDIEELQGLSNTLTEDNVGQLINAAGSKTFLVDGDRLSLADSEDAWTLKNIRWDNIKAALTTYFNTLYQTALGFTPENAANKDASGGYAGLTLFALNARNAANTITSFITNAATAARTWTMPDKDGTLATTTDTLTASVTQAADATLGSGTHTFDFNAGNAQKLNATGNITIAFSNVPSGVVSMFRIYAVNWGAYAITLPAHIKPNGTTLSFAVSGTTDVLASFDKDGVLTLSATNVS